MHDKINLLPDIKQQKLDEKRVRRLITSVALGISALAIGIPIVLLTIKGAQALALNRTQDQIDERKAQIQQTENITTMLTVKDHLDSLPALYSQRLAPSRLLSFLPNVLPTEIRLIDIDLDTSGSVTFQGVSATYNGVERFYKALLTTGTAYQTNNVEIDPNTIGLFTNVTLEQVSGPAGSEVSFTIKANFDVNFIQSASANTGSPQ